MATASAVRMPVARMAAAKAPVVKAPVVKALAVRHGAFGRATLNRLGRPLATHAHREGHVIVTLKGTGGAIELDGRLDGALGGEATAGPASGASGPLRLPLEPGHAVLISSWRPHRFVPGRRPSEFLTLYIAPEWFSALAGTPPAPDAIRFGASRLAMDERTAALADEAAAILSAGTRSGGTRSAGTRSGGTGRDEGCGAIDIEPVLAALAAALHERSWEGRGPGAAPRPQQPVHALPGGAADAAPIRVPLVPARLTAACAGAVGDFRIRRALRLMRRSVAEGAEIDLERTARESGLSRPHFFKLFRAHVGVTPGTYLNALKMERSYERLSAGRDTVTAIGLDLGFASQASFTRFFIAQSGIAPSDYRQAVAARRLGAVGAGAAGHGMAGNGMVGNGMGNETVGYA